MLLPTLLCTASAAGAASHPSYDLRAAFDVAQSTLTGLVLIRELGKREVSIDLGNLVVRRIAVGGRELPVPAPGENVMTVPADAPIEIAYEAHFDNDHDSLVSGDAVLLQGIWYPYVDGMHTYRLRVALPDGFEPVSEANAVRRVRVGGEVQFEFDYRHPLPAADGITLVASKQFAIRTSTYGKVELATYLSPRHAHRAEFFLTQATRYLQRFERLLGPYPFKRLSIVEAPRGGGLSMPTYILLRSSDFEADDIKDTALGHEIAHQWFGNLAYIDYDRGNWAEGLAIYFGEHAEAEAKDAAPACRKCMIEGYENNAAGVTIPLTEFAVRHNRSTRSIGYAKSAMVFHMLRRHVGDAAFFRSVRGFLRAHRFGVAGWNDLQHAFERESRQNLGWFFEQWLTRTDVPEFRVEDVRSERVNTGFALEFSVVQAGKPFRLDLPVTYRYEGGERRVQLRLDSARRHVRVVLPARPREIVLDEDYDVFRRPCLKEITPTIERLLTRPQAVVVANGSMGEPFAALAEAFEQAEAEVRLQWRRMDGPRKIRSVTRESKQKAARGKRGREVFKPGEPLMQGATMRSASLILLGRDNPMIAKLLGDLSLPDSGFSITVRSHPLNPAEVVAIVTADSEADVKEDAGPAMVDYEKSSEVQFKNGKVVFKQTQQSEHGIRIDVP